MIRDPKIVRKEQSAIRRKYEAWRKTMARRPQTNEIPVRDLPASFASLQWHIWQECFIGLRKTATILTEFSDTTLQWKTGNAALDAIDIAERMFYRGEYVSEMDAVQQSVWCALECALNIPTEKDEALRQRGLNQLRLAKMGQDAQNAEHRRNWQLWQEYGDEQRGKFPHASIRSIREKVVDHFREDKESPVKSLRTIRRRVKIAPSRKRGQQS